MIINIKPLKETLVKTPENGKSQAMTLKNLLFLNPRLEEEINQLIASKVHTETLISREELRKESIGNNSLRSSDPHYALYESIQTPLNYELDTLFVFGTKREKVDKDLYRQVKDVAE